MLKRGHRITGLCVGAAVAHACHGDPLIGALVAQWASGAPDIDTSQSAWGRHAPFVSLLVKHRHLTHWPLTCAVVGVALSILVAGAMAALGLPPFPFLAIALTAGVASHLLADQLTEEGLQLGGPFSERFFRLPRWLAVKSGTRGEAVMCGVIVGVAAWWVYDLGRYSAVIPHLIARVHGAWS
jgi:membrane-bound metal-dependent hydrolase YbcI (DUF457 family)